MEAGYVKRNDKSQRLLRESREKARKKSGYDWRATRQDLTRLFKEKYGKPPYDWQIDVAEALLLPLDAVVIAGTGARKTFPFMMPLLLHPEKFNPQSLSTLIQCSPLEVREHNSYMKLNFLWPQEVFVATFTVRGSAVPTAEESRRSGDTSALLFQLRLSITDQAVRCVRCAVEVSPNVWVTETALWGLLTISTLNVNGLRRLPTVITPYFPHLVDGPAYYAQTIRKSQAIKVKQKLMTTINGSPGHGWASRIDAIWQKDVHEPGKATCPKWACFVDLVKKHLDKEICKDTKKKQDKEPRKNGSLKAFFKEKAAPIATFLKSIVRAPSPIRGAGISAKKIPLPAETYPRPAAAKPDTPSSRVIQLLDHLRANVELLPSTIPDADVDNPLSEFAAEPTEYVSQSMPAGELWEALSPTFHRVFGYSMGPDERKSMVQRGSAGLDGTLRFLDYFIRERGLEGGMVELKIEQLIEAVQSVLHDTSSPPGEYSGNNDGVLILRSINCAKLCKEGRSSCRAYADLPKHPTLQGILQRTEEGIPESANYAFNPTSGLIEHLRRKNGQIKQLRMRGFNAVKRIAVQTRSLNDHKRCVRAIGSGKVENVNRLVRVQLGRKQGIRGLLSTYDEAAKGVYQPKSFTEEDYLRGVLLWKLAGNRVADFAHRAESGFRAEPRCGSEQRCRRSFLPLAGRRRTRWDPRTNNFLGVCREHTNKASLQFNSEKDLEELFRAKEEGKVHFAGEATVAAIDMLSEETRLYAARPVLISGDSNRISPGYASRGKAFIDLTFDHLLSDDSDIYDLLKDLEFMDFWSAGLSSQHIHAILNPDDKQDVKLAFDLLKDIWSLPPAPADARPGFASAREAVRIIGSLFYHLLFPYVCVDLTLSEQLEHLSAATHLLLILYRDGQKDAIPTLLYTDIMIMIKNAYFCVAKAKVDDPTGKIWLILLGFSPLLFSGRGTTGGIASASRQLYNSSPYCTISINSNRPVTCDLWPRDTKFRFPVAGEPWGNCQCFKTTVQFLTICL
ncbi:hypothetical protein DFH08DRAFT_936589 [Mycena albidolilacea]|uniref:Uncharacterized protein n=1 Tax=Mycena albidolilacea TaxID=1033008 RepID=A0AAD7ESG8_9AGAR|nr:hypothetical protein DFH08DRAFT_936589 [Mycena albidolilacea]